MGTKRVEGKKKRKSIKANVTSRSGQKKKLSRMGKKVKKGQMGPSTDFITRSSVLKKLQITLKDFRRLCILKGIYPRVPPKPPKGADKVYYDIKDIAYLNHEPLLHKFREFKAFMKKVRREAGRYQFEEARRRNEYKPVLRLDHLVKERYPRFVDALRDLDDALCMVHLFAALPSKGRITAERTKLCSELVKHWQYYIARTKTLTKSFISIKGAYFQAEILGEPITWLQPHSFTQVIPKEVDMRVMLTFLEFYEVFLKFVLYKLYHMQGWRYPPVEDKALSDAGCFLLSVRAQSMEGEVEKTESTEEPTEANATTKTSSGQKHDAEKLKSLTAKLDAIAANEGDEDDDSDDEDEAPISGVLDKAFEHLYEDNDDGMQDEDRKTFAGYKDEKPKLFHKLKFFVNREVPLPWMQLCIISFGGQIGWEGLSSPFSATDAGITHHIVDRPMSTALSSSREYIQPQWVFDSINAQMLLPTHRYKPGMVLPPHLSPFVDDDKVGYVPKYRDEVNKLKSTVEVVSGVSQPSKEELSEEDSEDDGEEDQAKYQQQVQAQKKGAAANAASNKNNKKNNNNNNNNKKTAKKEEMESEEEEPEVPSKKGPKGVVFKPDAPKITEDEEAHGLNKIMMSRKTQRLYDNMQHGIKAKQDAIDKLNEKRKRLEDEEADNGNSNNNNNKKGNNAKGKQAPQNKKAKKN